MGGTRHPREGLPSDAWASMAARLVSPGREALRMLPKQASAQPWGWASTVFSVEKTLNGRLQNELKKA